jgi:hypothetical protein
MLIKDLSIGPEIDQVDLRWWRGMPVLLPHFEPTFSPQRLDGCPEEVWALVIRLWRDRKLWGARAAAGRDFVAANCDPADLPARLARLATIAGAGVPGMRSLPV